MPRRTRRRCSNPDDTWRTYTPSSPVSGLRDKSGVTNSLEYLELLGAQSNLLKPTEHISGTIQCSHRDSEQENTIHARSSHVVRCSHAVGASYVRADRLDVAARPEDTRSAGTVETTNLLDLTGSPGFM